MPNIGVAELQQGRRRLLRRHDIRVQECANVSSVWIAVDGGILSGERASLIQRQSSWGGITRVRPHRDELRVSVNEVAEVEVLRAAVVDSNQQATATTLRRCIDKPDLLGVGAGLIDQAFG